MDESVLKGMARWPNVPSVFSWLSLDRRGNWLIKGERIGNPGVIEFIARNYEADERGRWFFQNGPQRVFVTLAYAPFVLRTIGGAGQLMLQTHTGQEIEHFSGVWLDEEGTLVLRWAGGVGTVSDRDLDEVAGLFCDARGNPLPVDALAKALDPESARRRAGFWFNYRTEPVPVGRIRSTQLAQKFGFDPDPRPAPGEPEC
ncbi:MAG TPA: DUF2946 family protein [Burkholderiales bacterium]|nr:DUF2946 family protein [Burkholderiales bacterium]